MNVKEAILNRRSVRSFLNKPIEESDVNTLVEALRWAPSAGNLQSRRFYFVFNNEIKLRIAGLCLSQMFMAKAPLVIVACADYDRISHYGRRGEELYVIEDVAVAVENLMLQATELGLGSVCVGAFDEDGIGRLLDMPDFLRPVAVIPVGYPAHCPSPPKRLHREEIVEVII